MKSQTQSETGPDNEHPEPSMLQRLSSNIQDVALRSGQYYRLIELIAYALILPVAGLLLFEHNPTGVSGGFPWVAAAPVIFTVRYGCAWGVSCAVLMAAFINLPFAAYTGLSAANGVLGLGTIALCLIIGDISSATIKRRLQSESENQYLRHRLRTFSTDYHILKVSHEQLEEYMAGQRLSLRAALQKLKPLVDENGLRAADDLMAVFSQFCSVQTAGLYVVSQDVRVEPDAVSTVGAMPDLSLFDPVLQLAMKERELVSIRHDQLKASHRLQGLIAVAPLVDSKGCLHGLLAVKEMHFMAFQQPNLDLLALLGSYVGNLLSSANNAAGSQAERFLDEVRTSLQFSKQHYTQSVMLSLQFEPSDEGLQVAQFVCDGVRNLDASWLSSDSQQSPVVCLLFPMMSVAAGQAFLQRLDKALIEKFDIQLSHIMQDSQIRALTAKDSLDTCKAFFSVHVRDAVLNPLWNRDGVRKVA